MLIAAALAGGCASPRAKQSAADALGHERQAAAVSVSGGDGVAASQREEAALAMPGSDAARDDLYCWAILGVHFDAQHIAASGEADRFLAAQKRLEAAGVARLTEEGVTAMDDWASRTVAYAETARADYRRNTLRLSPDACLARAAGLEKQGAEPHPCEHARARWRMSAQLYCGHWRLKRQVTGDRRKRPLFL